ncbi:hypothetical protein [Flagellimonas sp.]|uniref:hypothetical protein n=1 Tax=Flagellimonas sp. TaxID=2058762 RepID=UPI003B523FCB
MKKHFLNITLLMLILINSISCSKQDGSLLQSESGPDAASDIVAFQDWNSFEIAYKELSSSNSEDYILNWIFESDHSSLFVEAMNNDDVEFISSIENLTPAFLAILNKNSMFKVGETLIQFSNDKFYEVTGLQQSLNLDSEMNQIGGVTSDIVVISKNPDGLTNTITMGTNGNTAGYSNKDFWRTAYYRCSDNKKIRGASSKMKRYVQQLKSISTNIGPLADLEELFIETKLYYRNSSNQLRYSELEERNYTYNISGTVTGYWTGPYSNSFTVIPINLNNVQQNCKKGKWFRYRIAQFNSYDGRTSSWQISASGTIRHQINGDSYSWIAPVNW